MIANLLASVILAASVTRPDWRAAEGVTRVRFANTNITEAVTLSGDVELWLEGENSITLSKKSTQALTHTDGTLTICGPGSLSLTSQPAKKGGVMEVDKLLMTGGTLKVKVDSNKKNAAGILADGAFSMQGGVISVDATNTDDGNKQYGINFQKKAEISGGILKVSVDGPKSVALNEDNAKNLTISGGTIELEVLGDGAKGIKSDGALEMTDGVILATVSGDCLYAPYELNYGSDDEGEDIVSNAYVYVSSTYASTAGNYQVEDTTAAIAVKCNTVKISDGTIRVVATGVAARGVGADTKLEIVGGNFDISVAGDASLPVVTYDDAVATVGIDRATAGCLRVSETNGVITISGGTLRLMATGRGGKCISSKGALKITGGDIQTTSYGTRIYVAPKKWGKTNGYTTLGTPVIVADASYYACITTNVTSYSTYVNNTDTDYDTVDFANPKTVKITGDIDISGGRIRFYTAAYYGEGIESKANIRITGGTLEGATCDDCINASTSISISGDDTKIYCGSVRCDAIDSNGTLSVGGGLLLLFAGTDSENGLDGDTTPTVTGGTLVAWNGKNESISGVNTASNISASSYSGQYLKVSGANTYYVPVPTSSSSLALMWYTPGISSSSSPTFVSSPSGTAVGFHGVYKE